MPNFAVRMPPFSTTKVSKITKQNNNLRNGLMNAVYDKNGDSYSGEWKDNEKHGFGTQEWKKQKIAYKGSWKYGKRNGPGQLYRTDSISNYIYNGMWNENERCGQGIQFFEDGSRYEGEWSKDKRNGYGRMDYKDGTCYVGQWKNGERCGFGKKSYADGAMFLGFWHKDKRQGEGTLTTSKNDTYKGSWKNDVKHGEGKHHMDASGIELCGVWVDGIFCCGVLEVKNPDATSPMKLEIPKWTLRDPQKVTDEATAYYLEKAKNTTFK